MIVCVKCSRQMRPKQNGVEVTDLLRRVDEFGNEDYRPYKVWQSDLWECQDCGQVVAHIADVAIRFPQQPIAEHYQPGFEERAFKTEVKAKEWTR